MCSRRTLSDRDHGQLRSLAGRDGFPWHRLAAVADRHGILPLVATHLSSLDEGLVPGEILRQLEAERRRHLAKNLAMARALGRLLEALREAGIGAVPFKGPVLAADLYGSVGARQFGDLDVLVEPEAFGEAIEALRASGHRVARSEADDGDVRRFERVSVVTLAGPAGTPVELHRSLFPPVFCLPLTLRDVETRERDGYPALRRAGYGGPVRTLSPEDRLLVLCAHGGKHRWTRLLWLADVAATLRRRPQMDWDRLLQRADVTGARRLLGTALRLARDVLRAPVPRPLRHLLRDDPGVERGAAIGLRNLRAEEPPEGRFRMLREQAALRERRSDRARMAVRRLFRPNEADLELVKLPGRLHFLYRVLRPLRLLVTWGLARPARRAIRRLRPGR